MPHFIYTTISEISSWLRCDAPRFSCPTHIQKLGLVAAVRSCARTSFILAVPRFFSILVVVPEAGGKHWSRCELRDIASRTGHTQVRSHAFPIRQSGPLPRTHRQTTKTLSRRCKQKQKCWDRREVHNRWQYYSYVTLGILLAYWWKEV